MISDRVIARLKLFNMSLPELARETGIPTATIYRIANGEIKSPRAEHLPAIAKALNVSIDWLVTGKDSKKPNIENINTHNKNIIEIPTFNIEASMGNGKFPPDFQQPVLTVTVDKDFFVNQGINITSNSRLSIITGMGDSMETTFKSGDPLVVNQNIQTFVEDGIYLFTLNDLLYVKRLQRLPNCIKMISDNKNYTDYNIQGEELKSLIIHGKVLFAWNGRRI